MSILPEEYHILDINGVDPLALEKARDNIFTDLRCTIRLNSELFNVPFDVLEDFVQDWFIYERAGMPPIPPCEFLRGYMP